MNSIFKRVSVRTYLDKPVEDEKITGILRAAMAAPSAHNQQPWEFYVVRNKSVIEDLSQASPYTACAAGAAVVIAVCKRDDLHSPDYADQDLSACCENILIQAAEDGLGAVWLGIAPVRERMENVEKAVGAPEGLRAFALISLGYPAHERKQQDRFDQERIHYIN